MIASLLALSAIALWASIATLEIVSRDGYAPLPDLAVVYYPLP